MSKNRHLLRRSVGTCVAIVIGIVASFSSLLLDPNSLSHSRAQEPPANVATLPELPAEAISFFESHCLDCHAGSEGDAGVDFESIDSLDRFVKDRLVFDAALRVVSKSEMPPVGADQPTPAERERFTTVLSEFYSKLDAALPPQPGRVTMRRLNRVEYRNTIRDLIGVDFDPTEGFPSDDIGHGFDNIGEVLTLSPLLLERYLEASESIVSRAITPEPPPVPRRHLSTRYSEPAAAEIPMVGEYRVLSSTATELLKSGPIHTPYQWEDDGEYLFRSKVYKEFESGTLQVAIMVWGGDEAGAATDEELSKIVGEVRRPCRIIKIVDVNAADADNAESIEVEIPAMKGRERTALGIVRPAEGSPEAKLFVEHLSLRGPLDTRPASHRRLLAVSDPAADAAAKSREALQRFLRRAYRRPASADEVSRSVQLVEQSMAAGSSWEAGMQLAIQAALCSPKFLFRVELDDQPSADGVRDLNDFQLASRLSYFLWSSMPDDELLDLAERGELVTMLDSQVTRMMADPKFDAFLTNFAPQWLQIQRLAAFAPDTNQFPQFDDRLRRAMMIETEMFFAAVVRENRPITDLIDADFTYLNESLGRLYGIADTMGNPIGGPVTVAGGEPLDRREFKRVQLQDDRRGGLITMASVLSVTSNPTRTSPVKRGRWVLEQILGAPPPPPPPNVPLLEEGAQANASGSLRERLQIHRENPACANCHDKMDPIGFALENYDAIGAFRTHDGSFEIDASGQFSDGSQFAGIDDLKQILRGRRDDFAQCLIEKLMIYALGRGLQYYDRPTVLKISREIASDEDRFAAVIQQIVKSPPFRSRGAYDGQDETADADAVSTESVSTESVSVSERAESRE